MRFEARIKDNISAYLAYIYFDASLWTGEMREAKFVAEAVRLGVEN